MYIVERDNHNLNNLEPATRRHFYLLRQNISADKMGIRPDAELCPSAVLMLMLILMLMLLCMYATGQEKSSLGWPNPKFSAG